MAMIKNEIEVIELNKMLMLMLRRENGMEEEILSVCNSITGCIKETGCLIVKDERVTSDDNDEFINMMERYYSQEREIKLKDARPELHYQVGVTPNDIEIPRSYQDKDFIKNYEIGGSSNEKPIEPIGPDPKWRYLWRIGPQPIVTKYPILNQDPVIPEGFPEWSDIMNKWGNKLLSTVTLISECIAIGLGFKNENIFVDKLKYGPHLLAPTGVDLNEHGILNKCIAGFHYDMNFLTIHGKSRYPGLRIWLNNGQRINVKVPEGCLLLQAGKQLEWLTGGHIKCGMHEVVCTEDTLKSIKKSKEENKCLWRVSSTLFSHIASDEILEPLDHFHTNDSIQKYPSILAGEYITDELNFIKLKKS